MALSALFLGACLAASEWMWHGSFPWVYSHETEEWIYWRAGKDGRFYQWSQSGGGWQIYNDGSETWGSLLAPDLNETKWSAWETDPQAYGGAYTLEKIKSAILNSQNSLDLSYHRMVDLAPLQEATHLRTLLLSANQISNLEPLSSLTSLEVLHLNSNKISDLSPLSNLFELKELILDDNELEDLTGSDLSPLAGLTRLVKLSLADNKLSSLEHLGNLKLLEDLNLRGNVVSSLQSISSLTKVKNLDLGGNQVLDLSPIGQMVDLSVLYIGSPSPTGRFSAITVTLAPTELPSFNKSCI